MSFDYDSDEDSFFDLSKEFGRKHRPSWTWAYCVVGAIGFIALLCTLCCFRRCIRNRGRVLQPPPVVPSNTNYPQQQFSPPIVAPVYNVMPSMPAPTQMPMPLDQSLVLPTAPQHDPFAASHEWTHAAPPPSYDMATNTSYNTKLIPSAPRL